MMKAPPVVRAAHAEAVTGIKHDQYINAGGGVVVVYNEPHSSPEVCRHRRSERNRATL